MDCWILCAIDLYSRVVKHRENFRVTDWSSFKSIWANLDLLWLLLKQHAPFFEELEVCIHSRIEQNCHSSEFIDLRDKWDNRFFTAFIDYLRLEQWNVFWLFAFDLKFDRVFISLFIRVLEMDPDIIQLFNAVAQVLDLISDRKTSGDLWEVNQLIALTKVNFHLYSVANFVLIDELWESEAPIFIAVNTDKLLCALLVASLYQTSIIANELRLRHSFFVSDLLDVLGKIRKRIWTDDS